MECPRCKGVKTMWAHPVYADDVPKEKRKFWVEFPCHFCDGEGIVSDETPQWIKEGEILKDRRIAKKLVLRKACKLLKRKATSLSDMELGKVKPDLSITYDMIKIIRR